MVKKIKYGLIGILLLTLMLLPFSSAIYDWNRYGGESISMPNAQLPTISGHMNENVTFNSVAFGYGLVNGDKPRYQPIVRAFANTTAENPRIIFPSGNFLYVYDDNLNLKKQFSTGGQSYGSLEVRDFDNNGNADDIVGVWELYADKISFVSFEYNATSDNIVKKFEKNFSYSGTRESTGVRCGGDFCSFVASNSSSADLIMVFSNGSQNIIDLQPTGVNPYVEPPAWIDWDNDGVDEFLVWNKDDMRVIDENGIWEFNKSATIPLAGARFIHPDATSFWKLVYIESFNSAGFSSKVTVYAINPDGSSYWNREIDYTISSNFYYAVLGMAVGDYSGNFLDDVFIGTVLYNNLPTYTVLKGSDGTIITQESGENIMQYQTSSEPYNYHSFTIAKIDNDDQYDFIGGITTFSPKTEVFSIATDTVYYNDSNGFRCVGVDIIPDGSLELICQTSGITEIIGSNFTNQNPTINSVTYDPSTTVSVGSTVYAIISATDLEGDTMYYSAQCDNGLNYSADDTSNTKSCTYTAVGQYNLTIRARDDYHSSSYNYFSQIITVTTSGDFCDFDGVCEAGQGENSDNCPADCPVEETEENFVSETGGINMPLKVVDVDNRDNGLLPQIYYGLLGLFIQYITTYDDSYIYVSICTNRFSIWICI